MDVVNRTDLRELVEKDGKWHISIYLPTHSTGREQQQDPIRLKNLLAQAEKKLLEYGLRRPKALEILRPARELVLEGPFWQYQSQGLAIFLSEGYSRIYRLQDRFDELVEVSNSFQVKPLLPLLSGDGSFYILALSLNQVRLFQASKAHVEEVQLQDMPAGMEDALLIEDYQDHLGFHTDTADPISTGERPAMFYGQGVEDNKKDDILTYFHKVDAALMRQLENESMPMVIAAVEYLIPLYREANTYRNLFEQGLTGNPDRQDGGQLHEKAWKLVEPIFIRSRQEALDRFNELHGQQNGLASSDLEPVVRAAAGGRVETLIVPLGVETWGRYDPQTDSVRVDSEPTPWNEDLLNFAAAQTLLNSGNVYAVPQKQLPHQAEVAAIYRYAI
jgi:hypothetical protein